jgi:phosphoribosylformimino-5-aminoimidazole carboxamide ribotide isomerase
MLIIPAVDIRGGKCVRLHQGDYAQETVYGEDPAAMARRWIDQGAKFLHLVDLDGARDGSPRNKQVILEIAQKTSIPLEVGGGIRNLETIDAYLSGGIQRVILGTAAYRDPGLLVKACAKWPGRVAVDIAAKNGKAAISGWTQETERWASDLARQCEKMGASVIIYTDILRDGTQTGINLAATQALARALTIPVIASGGVSTIEDIIALKPLEKDGVMAAIVGRALYAGTLCLPDAIAIAEGKGG